MKKQNLIITTMTVFAAAVALTGCGNQKSANGYVTNSNIHTEKVSHDVIKAKKSKTNSPSTKSEKITVKKVEEKNQVTPVKNNETVVNTPASTTKVTAVKTVKNEMSEPSEKVQDIHNVDLDQVTLQQLVNVGMGYIATKTNMPSLNNSYWDYAKSAWGISDAQVLVKIGEETYQIFSQGSEQYQLTINGDTAIISARSNYTQTTKTVTMSISSMTILGSTF